MQLTIDPEFSSLIPPLADEEYAGLERSIREEGCRDALVVWKHDGQNILVDGHNRYRICQKYGIEFKTLERSFESRDYAIAWMCDNQLQRRNISTLDRVTLVDKQREAVARIAKSKQGERKDIPKISWECSEQRQAYSKPTTKEEKKEQRKKSRENETDYKIAKQAGVSEDTLRKVRTINEKADDRTKELVRAGQLSINQAFNSVHPKREDPVERAKKEHLEYEARKAEKQVSIQDVKQDKQNQKLINTALMKDVLKLLNDIDKFEMEHKGMDINKLSEMVDSSEERKMLIGRCNHCRKILFKIEEGFRD